MTNAPTYGNDPADTASLRRKWIWIVLLGLCYTVAGFIALGSVVLATAATVFMVGIMMIVAGVGEIISAWRLKSGFKSLLWTLIGVLYVVAGFVTFRNPVLAAAVLTLVLGISLVASGIVRLVLAFTVRGERSWVWVALSALITILLGAMIVAKWPFSSAYILGLFLGVDLIMAGISWIVLGFGLRRVRDETAATAS